MGQPVVQVDAFTSVPFEGNPAAVCVLSGPADELWMQNVASEMNLSETAFLHKDEREPAFRLRWFTPAVEVDLCGHATLAAAHVLWEDAVCDPALPIQFSTRSGPLSAARKGDWIELDFPTLATEEAEPPRDLLQALGLQRESNVSFIGRSRFDVLVELSDEATLIDLRPEMSRLAAIPVRGVIVTAKASDVTQADGFDFVSRFFAPRAGIAEDPVTGSAHCSLGAFWAARQGRNELVGYQASQRGGVVRVRVEGPRTILGGQAVIVLRGHLIAPG